MPIKSLESFLFERKLVTSSSIEILQNATIGIDVEHYLSRVYTFKKEQFLFGMGGVPSSLRSYIKSDLHVFKEFNIRPVFVLPGLNIQSQQVELKVNELSPQEHHLESTWIKLYSKHSSVSGSNSVHSSDSFRLHVDPLPIRPMINDLIKYFIEFGIDYIVSPYDASFQLSYLYQNEYIDSIYGSTDLLLTKIDKFILGMEFQSKDFRFVDKQKVLSELNLTERQFVDLSVMVGCAVQPETFSNFPPLPKPTPQSPILQLSYFKMALDIFFQYNSFNGGNVTDLFGYVASLNDQLLIDLYLRGHAAIKYMPIMNTEGNVNLYCSEMAKLNLFDKDDLIKEESRESANETLRKRPIESNGSDEIQLKIPTEIHNIISQRLPPEIYLYQSLGLLPLDLLEAITLGKFNIRPPMESGVVDGYKRLITSKSLQNTLEFQFNLITQLLARYYQVKKIEVSYWFRDGKLELNNRLVPPVFSRISHLQIVSKSPKSFTLKEFYGNLPGEFSAQSDVGQPIEVNDVVATALLRALFLLGVVDNQSNKLTSVGLILNRFVADNPKVTEEIVLELTLILLLLQTDSTKLSSYDKSYPGVPRSFKDDGLEDLLPLDLSKIAFISRIFSVHTFNIHPINYQGPISRSLLSFRSHLKFIQQNLITSIESCLVDMVARLETIKLNYKTKEQWYKLIDQIPFYKDLNNTLLGVVSEIYFEHCFKLDKAGTPSDVAIMKARDHLLFHVLQVSNSSFNINLSSVNSVTPEQFIQDFQGGVSFWKDFVLLSKIANEIDSGLLSNSDLQFIEEADAVVSKFSEIT